MEKKNANQMIQRSTLIFTPKQTDTQYNRSTYIHFLKYFFHFNKSDLVFDIILAFSLTFKWIASQRPLTNF